MKKFDCNYQLDAQDCGLSSLQMIVNNYGKHVSKDKLKTLMPLARDGVSLLSLSDAAEKLGFKSKSLKINLDQLTYEAPLPNILHWDQNHFVVLYDVKCKNLFRKQTKYYIADPACGTTSYTKNDIVNHWISTNVNGNDRGIVLTLEPTNEFYKLSSDKSEKKSLVFLFKYFLRYKKYFVQLIFGLLLGSIFQLIFPFLTQAIVDKGIFNKDIKLIYLILIAQLMIILSRTSVEFIRRWILLHISSRINISLISDFFIKLMKLPMNYFDTKLTGDLLQRINDHERLERFITIRSLDTIFSFFTLMIFGAVLFTYSIKIFAVFLIGSILYVIWIFLFLKKRGQLDYKQFGVRAEGQGKTYQLIQGMQEIKLQNAEKRKRWEWEDIQADLFKVNMDTLKLEQKQEAGNIFINESKNILITFLAALSVINNEMTLGMMLATQYIIGQLTLPIEQIAQLIHDYQDTKISLERINEIHQQNNENEEGKTVISSAEEKQIQIQNLTFQYEGPHSPKVLNQLNVIIPHGKTTAIVGASGSGKTTLIKLLLKYYEPTHGIIKIGHNNIQKINSTWWRNRCGVIMQDGFIFSESIALNIAVSSDEMDMKRLLYAARIANIHDAIMDLPLKYNTIIGQDGQNLSQGQRQRILIARAVYKDPDFLFLDEATNALDAKNEKTILENLHDFYKGKTVIVVAHRLSTVKDADQIIVLDKGLIAENGTHKELTELKGMYYNLVKNQLELGK